MATFIPSGGGFLVLGNNLAEAIDGTASNDTIYGYAGNDTIFGLDGNNYIDGGIDNDSIFGGNFNDTILGGAGDDTISGFIGFNILNGGAGNDSIRGDNFDTITGGAGADTIDCLDVQSVVYNAPSEGSISEVITSFDDFANGAPFDKILISAGGFGGGLIAGSPLLPTQFLSGAGAIAATTSSQRFLFDTTTSALRYDRDGTGIAAPVFIATVIGVTTLSEVDFVLF
jgi:Ca2+-binding RTX toxin-like protein